LVTAREEERRRLYRELHDGFGPLLAASALQAETARDLVEVDAASAGRLIDAVASRLRGSVDEVRSIVHGLRPAALDELGLAESLRELAARFASPTLNIRCEIGDDLGATAAAVDAAAYLITAEALTNVTRHAAAARASVRVFRVGGVLHLEITDDGCGISKDRRPGLGLASMRERVAELRGTFTVTSGEKGPGTRLSITLPAGSP
jgi:signal transduction histidine kinase